jgi:hypothetical protein
VRISEGPRTQQTDFFNGLLNNDQSKLGEVDHHGKRHRSG